MMPRPTIPTLPFAIASLRADQSGGGRYTAAAAAFKLNVAEWRSAGCLSRARIIPYRPRALLQRGEGRRENTSDADRNRRNRQNGRGQRAAAHGGRAQSDGVEPLRRQIETADGRRRR